MEEEYNYYAIIDSSVVVNVITLQKNSQTYTDPDTGETITTNPESILDQYSGYTIVQYGEGFTNNDAFIQAIYDQSLNAFLEEKPDPTYILNTETYKWEPDKDLEYDLHGDGIMYKWIGVGWILVEGQ